MSNGPLHIQNHTTQDSSRFNTSYATSQSLSSVLPVFVCSDGNFLAIGSHDNYIYIYAVSENGRKYSRVGKCSVSTSIYIPPSSVLCLFLVPPSSFKISSSSAPSPSPPPILYTLCSLYVPEEAVKGSTTHEPTPACMCSGDAETIFMPLLFWNFVPF